MLRFETMSSLIFKTSLENEKYMAMPTVQTASHQGYKAVVVVAVRDDLSGDSSRYSMSGEFTSYQDALLAGRRFAQELIETLP